jgi:hypothetical protein
MGRMMPRIEDRICPQWVVALDFSPTVSKDIPMKKTYNGSCHCGKVRFQALIDLAQGTGKCNCSICMKSRGWGAIVKPDDFTLLSGEEDLSSYQFASRSAEHLFCKTCGIKSFGRGNVPEIGGAYVSVNVTCLDDATLEELSSAPVRHMDGRNNNWFEVPAEVRYL